MITIAPPSHPTGLLASPTVADGLADLVARVAPSVVQIGVRGGGNGAGIVWRADGVVVTNRHVVHDDRAEVVLADGRRFPGVVSDRHPDHDIAVIRIDARGLPAAVIGDSTTVRPGQVAVAIGHPVGYRSAAAMGVVVAAGQAATPDGPRTGDWIQTDVTLLPGNSGGPLLDAAGAVIGVNAMVQGALSLAVPSQTVERFVAGGGAGGRGFVGIEGQVVPLRRADHAVGLLITAVADGGPADRAGLILGDVVVKVGETAVTDRESVPGALLRLKAGEAAVLEVLRGGEPRRFTVVPAERA